MRRFYKSVSLTGGLGIALDGREVKTPKKSALALPTRALAEAVAAEWKGHGDKLDPASMPLTRLANTALDRVAVERPRIAAEIVDYAGSDLVCYRADRPPDLVGRQEAQWNPVIDWALAMLDAPFATVTVLAHRPQPPEALRAVAVSLEALNDFELAALHNLTTLTGSALLALMLARRAIAPEPAWALAHVDEDYQIEYWGEDGEAKDRRARRHVEFSAGCRFLEMSRT
ncbi:MAG: ATPase [Rhizobiales bacterium]|nr:ATPase [Hyphomicrobiales bacterium]